MVNKDIIVAGDGHFHLYPCYNPANAIGNLMRNLDLMAQSAGGPHVGQDVFKIAFLAESRQHDYFHKIQRNEIDFSPVGLEVLAGPEEHCVSLGKDGKALLALVAGRQIVTEEKIEILGLGMEEIVPDGLPAGEVIEKIIAADALPVLAFSPGKWLFRRAGIVRRLVETKFSRPLLIGDSALRPLGWGMPEIMRRAGGQILAGSDPLPLPGDDKYAGCYGFICRSSFDPARPLSSMKAIMAAAPQSVMPAGRRCPLMNVAGRLFRLRNLKENKDRHIGT